MELIRGLSGGRLRGGACVMTIGTYDGIHLGHQALLARLNEHAKQRGEPTVLLTFEPMPREFLAPNDPPARLTSLRASCAPGSWSSVTTFASDAMARGPPRCWPRPGRAWGSTWRCWPR